MPNSNTLVAEHPEMHIFRFWEKSSGEPCNLNRPLEGDPDATVADRIQLLDETFAALHGLSGTTAHQVDEDSYCGIELRTDNPEAVLVNYPDVVAGMIGDVTGASGVLEYSLDGGKREDYDLARGENVMQGQAGKS